MTDEPTMAAILEAIEKVAHDVEQRLDQKLGGIRQELNELKNGQEQLRGELRSFKESNGIQIEGMKTSMTVMTARVTGMETTADVRFKGLADGQTAISANSDANLALWRGIDKKLDGLSDEVRGINTRLDRAKIPAIV